VTPVLKFTIEPYELCLKRIGCDDENLVRLLSWVERLNTALFMTSTNGIPPRLRASEFAMPPDRFHAELGAPEEQPIDGMQYTFTQKIVRIDAAAGFCDLQLSQLDGLLLALDWVADDKHHIWAVVAGLRANVTDGAAAPGWGTLVGASGTTWQPVICNGTAWIYG
jgi:hypothetical protein